MSAVRPRKALPGVLLTLLAVTLAGLLPTRPATADPAGLSHLAVTGVHNAYEQGRYPYFVDALESGAHLVELDVWTDGLSRRWRVSHDNPLGNKNNCEDTGTYADLRSRTRNHDLGSCLDNLRAWHEHHPDHDLMIVKLELKNGFDNRLGLGPDELDRLISAKVPDVYRPADLLAGGHATLDAAARDDSWPTFEQLRGRILFTVIPGTFELNNPLDSLHTDVEYASHLRALAANGQVAEAALFPAVLGAAAPDPRTRYDSTLRPWFVVFDGSAADYVTQGIDTAWYDTNHYLLVMTDAHAVPPALDATNPDPAAAQQRIRDLAARHASVVTFDWTTVPGVFEVLPRG